MYKLFLTLRYLRKRRIAYFAIAAVSLCVAMVLVVLSVMGGWLDMVKLRARGLLGDVIVDNRFYNGFPLYQEFIDHVSTWPEVVRATPVIYAYGLIRFDGSPQNGYVQVAGIRLNDVYQVNGLKRGLFYEKYYPGTTTLADQRQPMIGIDLSLPRPKLSSGEELLPLALPEPFRKLLDGARAASLKHTGRALDDPDSIDTRLNQLLRDAGSPIVPGMWTLNDPTAAATQPALEPPGPPEWVGSEQPGIILGRDIVAKREKDGRYNRNYPRGSLVSLTYWPTALGGSVDPHPRKQNFRYADDSRTGVYEIDSRFVYVDFDLLQRMLELDAADRVNDKDEVVGRIPARCSQIQFKLADGVNAKQLCARLTAALHELARDERFGLDPDEKNLVLEAYAQTWEETQAHIIGPVEKEKMLVTILFGIISLVAVALILCILYMIVLQKTRDIGIVKAIGGTSAGVATIWVFYGACVGVIGGILGVGMGSVFVWNINEVHEFLTRTFKYQVWDLQVYSFDSIPNEVNRWEAITVFLAAVLSSTLGSLAAAWRAGSMQPVEAIRYE